MIRVEKTVVINRPIETVFAFITDMDKVKLWLPVREIRQLTSGPIGVGSRYAQQSEFVGQRLDATIEVTEFEPTHVFAFKVVEGPFPLTTRITLAPAGANTQVTLYGEADPPGGAMKLAGPLVGPIARKQLETQAGNLKRALESQP